MSCEAFTDCKLPSEVFVASMDFTANLDGQAFSDPFVEVSAAAGYVTPVTVEIETVVLNGNLVEWEMRGGSAGVSHVDIYVTRSDGQVFGERVSYTVI